MNTWVALGGGLGALLCLLFLGLPIFVAFLVLNVGAVLFLFGPAGFGLFANSIYATATNDALATVPLFILMGEILFRSGAMEAVFDALDRFVGRIRGRQYVLCILLSAVMGALSGAAIAVAGLLGRSLYPAMRERGYDKHLSAGTLLGGASLDPIIPPSILAVIIAALAEVSTAGMLIAGIVPGVMLMGLFLVYVLVKVKLNPALAPEQDDPTKTVRKGGALMAVLRMAPCALVFFMVMGFIMFGVATPTESAATGVVGAVITSLIYRRFSVGMILESISAAAFITGLVLIIMCSAVIFSQVLSYTGAPRAIGELVTHLDLPGWLTLFAMLAVPFVLFMFLDQLAIMLVLIPIYKPLLGVYGFDPIWFWTLFLITATVGGLTPPFGYVLFALKSAVPDLSMTDIYKAAWPFVWIIVLGMFILWLFPPLVTFLPSRL
ncbi:MAG: transporter large permease subunit [Hyphomicrobiales bacterium]|nr:transporter large permease subunit [Hyphomicrobiales bacterium]